MSWRSKQEVQSGLTKEKRSRKNHQLSGRLPSACREPGVSLRPVGSLRSHHLAHPSCSHLSTLAFSSGPLSLWLNRGHPQGAASALYLHDLTTHPSPWGPRFPGEKLSSLAFRCEPSGLSTCGWAAGVTWQGELTVLTCNWDGPQEACAEGRFHFPISWCRVAVASLLMSAGGEICLIKGSA